MKTFLFILLGILALTASPVLAQQESTSSLEPLVDPKDPIRLDRSKEPYFSIRDTVDFPWMLKALENDAETQRWKLMEESAYDRLLRHAARFSTAELEAAARRDVTFADLVGPGRLSFKLDVVYLEGRLRQLRKADVTEYLRDNGINSVYEAWAFPDDESNPFSIYLTELPPGVEAQKDLSKDFETMRIGVAAYYFKLRPYEQRKMDRAAPGKHAKWFAPVLIGHSFTVLSRGEVTDGGAAWRMTFAPLVIAGFAAVGLSLALLAWRYHRGDRAILESNRGIRNQNPFDASQEG